MNLIYDGTLDKDVATWVKDAVNRGYPHAIEMTEIPGREWIEAHFPEHNHSEECDMTGRRINTNRRLYQAVWKNTADKSEGVFFFCKTLAEKNKVLEGLPSWVVNANPFKTIL